MAGFAPRFVAKHCMIKKEASHNENPSHPFIRIDALRRIYTFSMRRAPAFSKANRFNRFG